MLKKTKHKKAKITHRIETLVGQHTHITGELAFEQGLRIEGKVSGQIYSHNPHALLTIGSHAIIEGEVRVANVIISGQIHGDLYASQQIEITASANINGNVYYRNMAMAMGAEINGQLIRIQETDQNNSLLDEPDVLTADQQLQLGQQA